MTVLAYLGFRGTWIPNCRQIPRTNPGPISLWRGTNERDPVTVFSQASCGPLPACHPYTAVGGQMPLQVTTLHLPDFYELCGHPAFGRDRLAALTAKLDRLINSGSHHLACLLERSTLGLNLGKLRHVCVDEARLVAFEYGREPVPAHRHKGTDQLGQRVGGAMEGLVSPSPMVPETKPGQSRRAHPFACPPDRSTLSLNLVNHAVKRGGPAQAGVRRDSYAGSMSLDAREIASLILLAAMGLALLFSRTTRQSLSGILKDLLAPKILLPALGLIASVAVLVILGARIGAWEAALLLPTIAWVAGPGSALLYRVATRKPGEPSTGDWLRDDASSFACCPLATQAPRSGDRVGSRGELVVRHQTPSRLR